MAFQNQHWGQGQFKTFTYQREMFQRVWKDIDTRLIALITGPRRTGKSVLLTQLVNALITQKQTPPTQILYFEFSPLQSVDLIWQIYRFFTTQVADPRRPVFLFFDEIQYIDGYEVVLKELYDNTQATKVFVTGSLSLSYKRRMQESLSGRFFAYRLYPLNFGEYLQLALPQSYPVYQQVQVETNRFARQHLLSQLNADFRQFLAWGRLPEMAAFDQAQGRAYLQTVLSQSLNQDAFSYFEIEKPPILNALFEYLCINNGGVISVNSLSSELGAAAQTVASYLGVLEMMGLVYVIYNATNPLIRLNSSRKAYVSSMFALLHTKLDLPRAIGLAVESYVLERLLEREEMVTFYRHREREIDFLLPKKHIGYEVKYQAQSDPPKVQLPDFAVQAISLDQDLPACLF
jgi:hypothetical protein